MIKMGKEEEGVADVDGDEGGDDLSGSIGISNTAGDEQVCVDLLEFAGGPAALASASIEKGEGFPV